MYIIFDNNPISMIKDTIMLTPIDSDNLERIRIAIEKLVQFFIKNVVKEPVCLSDESLLFEKITVVSPIVLFMFKFT